ncbi:MAG: DUF1289 domain-containing protein [Ramlibacter sp.]|nr:DUF1289 domain-containing protein [Ramlibacter sp.]
MSVATQLIAKHDHLARATGQMVPSPCISVCRMNAQTTWCEGCLRSLEEIAGWSRLDDAGKRIIWDRIAQRARAVVEASSP